MGPPVSTAAPSATSSHPFLLHMSRTYIQSSYHQLSPLSAEMLKVLIPVPVPYTAVLTVISSITQRTEEQQGKRISNEDPYLPEKWTTSTTFLAQFSASKRPKSWSGRKSTQGVRGNEITANSEAGYVYCWATRECSQTASAISVKLTSDWAIGVAQATIQSRQTSWYLPSQHIQPLQSQFLNSASHHPWGSR